MSVFTIRKAVSGDEALMRELLIELAAYEKLQVEATSADIARDFFAAQPVVFCDLAFVDDMPVGLATWYWTFASFRARRNLYIEDLYVRPAWRGRGYGKTLFAHMARTAIAAEALRLEWQVLDWNAPSIAFYDSIGGAPPKGWLNYRLEGDAMKKLAGA